MKKTIILLSALLALTLFAGCKSFPKVAASHMGQPPVMLTHAGAAIGVTTLPDWVSTFVLGGNNDLSVEKLPDYKSKYCFVGTSQGPNRDFVITWANSIAGPQIVGATLSTRIESVLEATGKGTATGQSATAQSFRQQLVNNISATFSGVRPVGNYWVQWRTYDPDEKDKVINEDYTAYTLYTAEKKTFDNQIANIITQTIQDRQDLSGEERQLYSDLIARIMERGLDLE
jgi:hypothetical protein